MKSTRAQLPSATQSPVPAPQPRSRVLIVDADESSRTVLAVALGREGFDTLTAASSREASRLLAPHLPLPELMVVASELREEDGISFVAQIRGDRHTGPMPVLLLARGGEAHLHELSRVVGVDEILLKPAYARDVASLARLQLLRPDKAGARTLQTEALPVARLLRAVLSTSRSGVIELEAGRGRIAFRRGKVLDASFDGLHGIPGLMRSLALARGDYQVVPRTLAFDPAFHLTLQDLVTSILPRLSRWEELVSKSLPLDARLAVDFAALTRALPKLPDAVNQVVRLFDGLRDVRQVLMDSPLDEVVSLEVATRLYLMGVVVPAAKEEPLVIARQDPHLFEPKPTEAIERMDTLFTSNPTPIQVAPDRGDGGADWFAEVEAERVVIPKAARAHADSSFVWFAELDGQGVVAPRPAQPAPALERAGGTWDWFADGELEPTPPSRPAPLAPALEQQLAAFNIRPVIEPVAPPAPTELSTFTAGDAVEERPIEAALTAPILLVDVVDTAIEQSARALENAFFSIEETAPAAAPTTSVSEAVLGLSTEHEPLASSRIGALGWLGIVALLVSATAITAWRFAQNGPATARPAEPAVKVLPPSKAIEPLAPAKAVAVEPLEPVFAAPAGDSEALVAATKLYDSGKLAQAVKALEAIVTEDPSSTNAWLLLGLARYDHHDAAGAEEAANTVLALDPKAARAHLLLATILIDGNHRPEANEQIQQYLTLEPKGKFADEAKALLKR